VFAATPSGPETLGRTQAGRKHSMGF
jgi:hypothetical protein